MPTPRLSPFEILITTTFCQPNDDLQTPLSLGLQALHNILKPTYFVAISRCTSTFFTFSLINSLLGVANTPEIAP